jgi:prepilin-type N-terminal cleavage/methylation domain-containing protein
MPRRDGFTLIELLIVLVIIAILATIGVNRFWAAKDRSLQGVVQSDLRNMASANATHVSLGAVQCGYFTGNAPAAQGAPATVNGIINCN